MGRKRKPNSTRPLYGLTNCTPDEIAYLDKYLTRKGVSWESFKCTLVRGWVKMNVIGAEG